MLPYHVSRDAARASGFRLLRWWRAAPRLKRMVTSLCLLSVLTFLLYLYQVQSYSSDQEHSVELIQNNILQVIEDRQEVLNQPEGIAVPIREFAPVQDVPVFKGPQNRRQEAVRKAFQHAWNGYKKYAWGHDQLKPVSKSYSEWFDTGLTIVDSIDTAIIMNLKEEVEEATNWIEHELSFEKDRFVNLFETSIRVLGGLLSAYHLTGNEVFKLKSVMIGDKLLNGFTQSKTAIPLSDVNLKTGAAKSPAWSNEASLSEVTTLQLEFRDLSRITGNKTYEETAFKTSLHIHEIGCAKYEGLCEMYLIPTTGKFKEGTTVTFGARADSYYEYLYKQWLQTGKSVHWLQDDFVAAMNSMEEKLLRKSEPNQYSFVGELLGGNTYSPKMDHLVCFLAGTLADSTRNGLPEKFLEIAKGLGRACYAMYENPTGLGPEIAYYNMDKGQSSDLSIKPLDAHCLLRPEAVEAWFYLYRTTGDKMYQEWGWNAFQAIEKYAKLPNGYSSVNSVKKIPVTYRDLMESFFPAETLKYLYLLFADEQSDIPLDKWVFNTEAHPLPIYSY
ncbi:unnamed protein product [Auanema sp. JU1783]|nr:unnamed protein product [Auanema sp. JU1783]